ncbi:MAG TPA: hypothetical protein VIK65_00090 [Candidatus Limnocylindrales bacterium]
MADPLEQVLRLVAEGRLTAAEAAPILDALGTNAHPGRDREAPDAESTADPGERAATALRIQVTEGGRQVVNLRVPVSLGRLALERIPGMSLTTIDMVRQALAQRQTGTLLTVDDEGDGVRISLE